MLAFVQMVHPHRRVTLRHYTFEWYILFNLYILFALRK